MSEATRDLNEKTCRRRHVNNLVQNRVIHKPAARSPKELDENQRQPEKHKLENQLWVSENRGESEDGVEDYLS